MPIFGEASFTVEGRLLEHHSECRVRLGPDGPQSTAGLVEGEAEGPSGAARWVAHLPADPLPLGVDADDVTVMVVVTYRWGSAALPAGAVIDVPARAEEPRTS